MSDETSDETAPKYEIPTEYGVQVYRNPYNQVVIKQENPLDDDTFVVLAPERIETIIGFLRVVRDDILTDRADEAAARNQSLDPLTH